MATKVVYKQGTKATYLGLESHAWNALYFCTDTKELFRGDDLYSDGLRIVGSYSELPEFVSAADGILYFCNDTGCGYTLNAARDGWIPVIYGLDNVTVVVSDTGLLQVGVVPILKVEGLEDRLKKIESIALGENYIPNEEQFLVEDNVLTLRAVDSSIVFYNDQSLTDTLDEIMEAITWSDME